MTLPEQIKSAALRQRNEKRFKVALAEYRRQLAIVAATKVYESEIKDTRPAK